jgi:predicted membrane protein
MLCNSNTIHYFNGDRIDENAVFASHKVTLTSTNFHGGDINSVFGDLEINLANAEIETMAKMDVNVVFGNLSLILPAHWQINLSCSRVMGSIKDKRTETIIKSNKVLFLEVNALFSDVEIKNS